MITTPGRVGTLNLMSALIVTVAACSWALIAVLVVALCAAADRGDDTLSTLVERVQRDR